MAKRTSRQRIAPMIEAMPVLRDLVKDPRSRDSGNTQMVKEFLNGVLMNLALICMDSGGHFTDEVYAFSRKQGVDWVIPIKGASQSGKPIATFPTPALSPSLHLMGRKWIRSPHCLTLKNQADQPPELLIYDVIGDWAGLSARQLVSNLKDIDADEITVRINSPGGSVFDGIAIYNALHYHKAHINVRIEGLAASIASVIAMAGDTVHMAANALLMIHNPFSWVGGDAEELRKMADMLDKTTGVIAQTYASSSGLVVTEVINLMN